MPAHAWLFGEDQGRYLVTVPAATADAFLQAATAAGVPAARIGLTGGDTLTIAGLQPISIADLTARHEAWFPAYMSAA